MLLRLLLKDKPFSKFKIILSTAFSKTCQWKYVLWGKGLLWTMYKIWDEHKWEAHGPYCSPMHSQWILNLYKTLNWRRMGGRNSDQFGIYSRSWCFHNTIAQHNIVCSSVALEDFKNKFMYVYLCWALHTT